MRRIAEFGTPRILVKDMHSNLSVAPNLKLEWVVKETIYRWADVISLHVPLIGQTTNMIRQKQLMKMKQDALIINVAREGIINELDLPEVLNRDT